MGTDLIHPVDLSLPGATLREEEGALIFTVVDRERWNRGIAALEPIFGEPIFRAYERSSGEYNPGDAQHQERRRYQCRVSFADVDQLYVVREGDQPVGFAAIDYWGDTRCGVLRDILVRPAHRRRGHCGTLYRLVCEHAGLHVILGYTKSLAAIRTAFSAVRRHGYEGSYGNMSRRQPAMQALQERVHRYLQTQGLLAKDDLGLPAGYTLLRGELDILPADRVELPARRSDHLFEPLAELNEWQREVLRKHRQAPRHRVPA